MILDELKNYTPYNNQERIDKQLMIDFISRNQNCFTRENKAAHVTASSWIVNKDRTKVLMCFHKIYNSWSWTGGHADGMTDLLEVAIKEAKEETGISNFKVLNDGQIYSIEVLNVNGHYKNGEFIQTHLHLNVTYLLEANEEDELIINKKENSGLSWFKLDEVSFVSNEHWMVNNIYKKLNEKLKK